MDFSLIIHVVIFCRMIILPSALDMCKNFTQATTCKYLFHSSVFRWYLPSAFTQLFSCWFPETKTCYLLGKICVNNGTLKNSYTKEQFPEKEADMWHHSTKHKKMYLQEDVYLPRNTCVILSVQKFSLWVPQSETQNVNADEHEHIKYLI